MTEDEAKNKQCCGPEGCGRVVGADFMDKWNNDITTVPVRFCVGSECMGWRISHKVYPLKDCEWCDGGGYANNSIWPWFNGQLDCPRCNGRGLIENLDEVPILHGHCGLAGKP